MSNYFDSLRNSIPVAPLKLAALEGCKDFAAKVNQQLVDYRHNNPSHDANSIAFKGYSADTYMIDCACPRFGSGEGKGVIYESVRGCDLFILADITNSSLTYNVCGLTNRMSPDNHFQDIKRIISASDGKTKRINVIMPFLYEGRQHKRSGRESLDCALALQELANMGVSNILTFDAHDPRVQNAVPLIGFDTFMPTYQFLKTILECTPDFQIDSDHLMVISPDEGAMNRAVYFSTILGVDMGMFYKRRDYSTVINGKNPIVAHEFLGDSVEGKDVLIVDDMISSGESMLDVAKQLKDRKAKRVFVCTTFGLFTDGFDKFDEFYSKGYIDRIITTNLNYRDPVIFEKPYYKEADMSSFLASIIDCLNHDVSLEQIISPTAKLQKLLAKIQK